ncbi:MAG: N-acetylmuramoyl-L-alanine amidase [Terriglobales bacterium]
MLSAATHKTLATLLAALILLGATPSADEKRISVYSTVATYALPVVDRNGREYVGLLEILEPLGRVSARVEGQRWKLRFNDVDSEFVARKIRGRIRGRDLDLAAPFLIENSRGLAPLSSLTTLLPRFLGAPVNFHESARRLFIGDAATQVHAQLDATNPPRLVLNFSAPVNPTISTEPGKLRMVFTRDPLVPPGGQTLSFDSKTITQTTFSESNGSAELVIAATAPLMASFSNNGRTITVAAAPQAAVAGGVPTPPQPAVSNLPSGAAAPAPAVAGNGRRLVAVVDPAHGGDERGAALSDKLAEKDVTLGFARLLRHELETRGISVLLLRDGDTSFTLDQRAGGANASHAGIYLSLHASSQGTGARVYTALLPVEGEAKGIFHAWNAVQAPALPVSRSVAAAIVSELQKKQFPARQSAAALRPLNNVQMAAVAVELAPGPGGIADLPSAEYQQKAAAAIADAVASLRDRLGAQP